MDLTVLVIAEPHVLEGVTLRVLDVVMVALALAVMTVLLVAVQDVILVAYLAVLHSVLRHVEAQDVALDATPHVVVTVIILAMVVTLRAVGVALMAAEVLALLIVLVGVLVAVADVQLVVQVHARERAILPAVVVILVVIMVVSHVLHVAETALNPVEQVVVDVMERVLGVQQHVQPVVIQNVPLIVVLTVPITALQIAVVVALEHVMGVLARVKVVVLDVLLAEETAAATVLTIVRPAVRESVQLVTLHALVVARDAMPAPLALQPVLVAVWDVHQYAQALAVVVLVGVLVHVKQEPRHELLFKLCVHMRSYM